MSKWKTFPLRHNGFGLLLTGALMCSVWLAGCSKHTEGEAGAEGESKAPPSPIAVQVATAGPEAMQPVLHLSGRVTLEPGRVASISAPFECVVETILATEGQYVAKGAPIVQMDQRSTEYEVAKTSAVLAKTRAATSLLKAGARPEDVEVARQDVVARESEAKSQEVQLAAKEELRQKNMISAAEIDDTQRKLQAAQAALKAARAKLDLLEKGPRPDEVAEAEGDLAAAVADDAQAKLRLDRCTVKAPIEGILVKLAVHPGMGLAAAAPIAEIVDLRVVLVESVVPASRLAEVRGGGAAHITTAAYPDHPFEGKVIRISHQADADTGNVPMWIAVDNPEQLLRRDMVVRAAVNTAAVEARVVVPESAIAELDGKLLVMVVRDGKTHNVPVTLGKHVDDKVEVLTGVAAGDQVITAGGYGLPDGYPVNTAAPSTQEQAGHEGGEEHAS